MSARYADKEEEEEEEEEGEEGANSATSSRLTFDKRSWWTSLWRS